MLLQAWNIEGFHQMPLAVKPVLSHTEASLIKTGIKKTVHF